jgi:AcrR family transcriptional regulator
MTAKNPSDLAGSGKRQQPNPKRNTRARRAEVIRAASNIFFEKGYRATTIQDIGKAMGFTSAALYYYIGSKHQILVDIVLEPNRRLMEIAERIAILDVPATEQLRRIVHEHVTLMLNEREMFGVMFRERIELDEEHLGALRELEARYFAFIRGILERGAKDKQFVIDDVSVAALGLLGMINWTTRWYKKDGRMSPEQIAQHFFDHFYLGIGPRARTP